MKIVNSTKQTVIAENARVADTFKTRLIGLMNRSSLGPGEALVITRCQSIHMLFMRFSIDVIFVDRDNVVVGLVRNIRPYRLSPIFFRARSAIELSAGMIEQSMTARGDRIEMVNNK